MKGREFGFLSPVGLRELAKKKQLHSSSSGEGSGGGGRKGEPIVAVLLLRYLRDI